VSPGDTSLDRVTQIRVQGLRSLADVTLPLSGLTVIIGENGSGKSSLLEAIEMLRKAATATPFVERILAEHGDLAQLVTQRRLPTLHVRARVEGAGPPVEYSTTLQADTLGARIIEESLEVINPNDGVRLPAIRRNPAQLEVFDERGGRLKPHPLTPNQLALTAFGLNAPHVGIDRAQAALQRLRIDTPFDVRPMWAASESADRPVMRVVLPLEPAPELLRLGRNVASCFFHLKQDRADWPSVLQDVRAGLGLDVSDIKTPVPQAGRIGLSIEFASLEKPIPAEALSEGQLAYLGFVALSRFGAKHSLVAYDEPERHMHPALLVRVLWLYERLAEQVPVVLCTHSDTLLDAVSDPGKSVVLCELDDNRHTKLLRPDAEKLRKWLDRYRGLGEIRAQGYGREVFAKPSDAS